MCGIAGFVGRRDSDALKAMCQALAHRGGDGDGLYENDEAGVHFGHRRLAVIDLKTGSQPMRTTDGQLTVVFNGEIYNHIELRRELEALGYHFISDHSDTEVLLHGYREWGDRLPVRLNGMFAFAIHDARTRRLFLARDRFGEKPLFIFHRGSSLAFASESSALRHAPGASTEIDQRSLQKLFAYGYLPGRNALYRHCIKLPAGTHLTYDLADGSIREAAYWQFRIETDQALEHAADDQLAEELRALLKDAVRTRSVADVPLGLFLSGGLDSSSILAMAADLQDPRTIKTFTIGFDDPSFDESRFAQQVATHFGTEHGTEQIVIESARNLVTRVLGRMDEPIADASILPTYQLSQFTRRHVTVALSGDGGDELFAGYDPFAALKPAGLYAKVLPRQLHQFLRWTAERLPRSHKNMSFDFKIRRTLQGLSYPESAWNPAWMAPLEPLRFDRFFANPLPAEELYSEAITLWENGAKRGLSVVDRTLEFFTRLYLTDDILVKSDRASMAHTLEARAVFLDNGIVDFCARLPSRFKFRNGERKYLLKKAMGPILPREIIGRRKKGFGIPLSRWLKDIPRTVPMTPVPGVKPEAIAEAWTSHRSGRTDDRLLLFAWLALQETIRPAPAAAPSAPTVHEAVHAG